MIFNKNIINPAKQYEATVAINDFSGGVNTVVDEIGVSTKYCARSFNFNWESKILKDGLGIKEYKPMGKSFVYPQGATLKGLYYFKRYDTQNEVYADELLAYFDNKKVYKYKIGSEDTAFKVVSGLTFDNTPVGINYKYNGKNVIILSAEGKTPVMYDGESVETITDAPQIKSMCIHYERLYVATGGEGTTLWFSDDFDPTNWYVSLNEAGYIDFQDDRGQLLKVLSFQDYVYIFRTSGISRLQAYGSQEDFEVTQLYTTSGKIYPQSITVCGDRIIFLAEDGFYEFNGLTANRILVNYDGIIKGVDNSDAAGEFYNGNLYMNMKINDGGIVTNVTLVYKMHFGTSYLYKGPKINAMCKIVSQDVNDFLIICGNNGKIGTLTDKSVCFSQPLEKVWESPKSDFGLSEGEKVFSGMSLDVYGNVSVTVESDKESKTFNIDGNGRECVRTAIKGDVFKIILRSKDVNIKISRLKLHFRYSGGK